jgi:hypothetical protein
MNVLVAFTFGMSALNIVSGLITDPKQLLMSLKYAIPVNAPFFLNYVTV